MASEITRRGFIRLSITAAGTAMVFTGCPPANPMKVATVFLRSGRGRRVSNAAKNQNNNRLYVSEHAAAMDAPHPGDNSKIVSYLISRDDFDALFPGGRSMVDLRQI